MKKMCFLLVVFAAQLVAQQNTNLNVLSTGKDTLQKKYFLDRLHKQFENRREKFAESINSLEAFSNRQNEMRKWFTDRVGTLPAKTELNISVTKKAEYENYSVEWIAFESRPDHHVTGLFYLPKKYKPPFPAVYIPCGHSLNGKASETYQKAARLFAMNGFAVLQADPICQGERLQYLDENGKPLTKETTHMHEILGEHLMLTGSNSLIHELYDNVRCLDFLEQNPLVDKNKLAVAGNSGGGTQSTYLTAYDRRIKAAVVSCYIATTEKKFNTIGSQDGCQQLWGEGKEGIEEQDFLMIAAPTPIAVMSATEDYFNKEGAKTAASEIMKAYNLLGVPEKFEHVFADGKHGWHKPLREEAVRWCRKWLVNDDTPVVEPDDIGIFTDDECRVTASGQILTNFEKEISVADISRERVKVSDKKREVFLRGKSRNDILAKVKDLIGFEEPLSNPESKSLGIIGGDGFTAEKFLIKRGVDSNFMLPAVLFMPERVSEKPSATILTGDYGDKSLITENVIVKDKLSKGNVVLVLDVSNSGELKDSGEPHYDNVEFWVAKLALYEGKTLLTYRAEDILTAKSFLMNFRNVKFSRINLVSYGLTGPAAFHAAFLDGGFGSVEINNAAKSWRDVANSNYTSNQLGNIVPGVLNYYDLPDLIRLIPGTSVKD